jgi:integrase
VKKPPALRNNNGVVQVRIRVDGRDHFINRIGRWDDPIAHAKASAIAAQIWADHQQGILDASLLSYQPAVKGKEVGLLAALTAKAEQTRQSSVIHAHRLLLAYGRPLKRRSDVEDLIGWMREERGLSNRTISSALMHYRTCSGGNRHLFSHTLKIKKREVQSDVLSATDIQAVLADLKSNEQWFYPLFLLWMSTGLRNGEIRGLTWDCIRWGEGEILICKTLRRDGYSSRHHIWGTTKTGKQRVVPLTPLVAEVLQQHQKQMQQLGLYDPNGLLFLTPNTHSNVYDHLLARVWCRSLKRCGLQPRRLYAQRHTFLSHALAMGNSPAELAAAAGHSTKMLLETYAKPTGRLLMPSWATAAA